MTRDETDDWFSAAIQFCQDTLLYGFNTFLPSIITSMGFSSLDAQYLTIPVYIIGGISFPTMAWVSDRFCIRGPFIAPANIFGILGYILILYPIANGVKFFGAFVCAIAVYDGPGLNMTCLNVNVAPHYRRAVAIGAQRSLANCAGIILGQIYRTSPYVLGNAFSVGPLGLARFLILAKWLYARRCNVRKAKIQNGDITDTRKVKTGDRDLDLVCRL
ncbi:hypothetical protein OQA88_8890 [Cercophora sp. LCS_1]